eukprot:8992776-Heterocapsa_arctica.AAC.1
MIEESGPEEFHLDGSRVLCELLIISDKTTAYLPLAGSVSPQEWLSAVNSANAQRNHHERGLARTM